MAKLEAGIVLSIVVPFFNEEGGLDQFLDRVEP